MNTSTGYEPCKWCGIGHLNTKCPLIKAIEYHQNGTVKRVEFMTPNDQFKPAWTYPPPSFVIGGQPILDPGFMVATWGGTKQ